MTALNGARTTGLVLVCCVVTGVLMANAHSRNAEATRQRQEVAHVEHRIASLNRDMHRRAPAEAKVAPIAATATHLLSKLRRVGAMNDVTIGQITLAHGGASLRGTNMHMIAAAAHSAKVAGLKRIDVNINGSWKTLADLTLTLDTLGHYPVRVVSLNIANHSFGTQLAIFGR